VAATGRRPQGPYGFLEVDIDRQELAASPRNERANAGVDVRSGRRARPSSAPRARSSSPAAATATKYVRLAPGLMRGGGCRRRPKSRGPAPLRLAQQRFRRTPRRARLPPQPIQRVPCRCNAEDELAQLLEHLDVHVD
jgi:hypothetical protein